MAAISEGRWAARIEGDFVVFLIGMRVNRWRAIRSWLPVTRAMVPMLRELMADKESGLLGFRMLLEGPRSVMLVQYWRSVEHLQRYANDEQHRHRPAWLEFFRRSYRGGAVGIWHETYLVQADAYETVYGNMPRGGLAAAGELVPVARVGERAADRLARSPSTDVGG